MPQQIRCDSTETFAKLYFRGCLQDRYNFKKIATMQKCFNISGVDQA